MFENDKQNTAALRLNVKSSTNSNQITVHRPVQTPPEPEENIGGCTGCKTCIIL